MASMASDSSRRDDQFRTRIMTVDQFPTSTFVLTSPIDFGAVPAEGTTITATATGDLTLRGVTKPVTFDVQAKLENGRIGVLGNIPIRFSDYQIPDPSNQVATVKDNGLLEFVLVFERA
jgi:polyisoprenoid-binding protein YceI